MTTERTQGEKPFTSDDAASALAQATRASLDREALWPKTAEGWVDTRAAMTTLVRLFPTLRDAMGVEPWDLDLFLAWACGAHSSGMLHAAKFVLSVWNPTTDWNEFAHEKGFLSAGERLAPFNMHDALGAWDFAHRDAFAKWVHGAFWP